MRQISFTLSKPLKLPNRRNLGANWKAAHAVRAAERRILSAEIVAQLAGRRPEQPFAFAEVIVQRVGIRAPDFDNLYASAKALLDCMQPCTDRRKYGLGVIADDGPAHIVLRVEHIQAKRLCEQCTEITIRELAEMPDRRVA